MLSRVAETIFWLARYMERTNGMLQVMRTSYISSQDDINDFSWKPVLNTYGSHLEEDKVKEIEEFSPLVLDYLILSRDNPASVFTYITNSRENARSIQDHITKEVWQCLNDYYHFIRDPQIERQIKFGDPITAIDLLIKHNLSYTGTVDITLNRGEVYTYLNLGKFLERAIQTTDILRIKLSEMEYLLEKPAESPDWKYLLYSLFGFELYIKTYRGDFKAEHVLELVLQNVHFPHSILYSVEHVYLYFQRLKLESKPESFDELEYLIGKTMNYVKYTEVEGVDGTALKDILLNLRRQLFNVGSAFGLNYF